MKKHLTVFLLSSLIFWGCNSKTNTTAKNGRDRIVCVSKQLTELMFALQQGSKIVGVDLSSTYPSETSRITSVGYHRHLSAEGILSLDPTVIIHQGDVAPPEVMEQIKSAGIPVKVYPLANTLDSTKMLIKALGKEFNKESLVASLISSLDSDLSIANGIVKKYPSKPRVLIIHYGQQMNQYFVMGTKGTANQMIDLAGGMNAADTTSFRVLSPEAILRSQPDVILATDFGFDRMGNKEKFSSLPGLALTPAAKNGKIYRVEEHDLVYFGPRTGKNILKIADLIHR